MKENIYKAFSEVDTILEYSSEEIRNKVPDKFRQLIKNNKDNEICLLNVPIGYVATAALDVLGKETYMGSNEYILKMIRDFKNGTIKTE